MKRDDAAYDPVTAEVIRSAHGDGLLRDGDLSCRGPRPRRSSTSATSATRPSSTPAAGSPPCRSASPSSCCRRRCRCVSPSTSSGDDLQPGDVIVANDPYHGGGHLPDFNVFAPVFDDDGALGALRVDPVPPRRHRRRDGRRATTSSPRTSGARDPLAGLKIVDARRRTPRRRPLRMQGQQPAARTSSATCAPRSARRSSGAERLGEHHRASTAPTRSSRRASGPSTDARRALPPGDHGLARRHLRGRRVRRRRPAGNQDIHVHVAGHRRRRPPDHRLRRAPTRGPRSQAWSTFGNTRGNTIAQLASMVDPTIPKNEGFFDCIDLRVPEGCVLNPTEGKPVSSGTHHPGVEVGDAIALAMQPGPSRPCAPQTLQVRQPAPDVGRPRPAHRASFFDHGGEVNAGWVNAVGAWTAGARWRRQSAT